MMKTQMSVTADFDGTLFDPNWKIFLAAWYNRQTSALLKKHHVAFILNTGRPHWDPFAHAQMAVIGMKKPDVVIYGAGTKILWMKNNTLELDQEWERAMNKTKWDKTQVIRVITPILEKYNASLFDTHNPHMTRVWMYNMPVTKLTAFIKELQVKLPDTKILRTEQILLPNTMSVFSGYLLLIPQIAGKETAMRYVLKKLGTTKNLAFGDAAVDVSMLRDPEVSGFLLNPTAIARKELENSSVTILEGSPPKNLLKTVSSRLKSKRNSPYRFISERLLGLIEPLIYPKLTPDELSLKGLELVKKGGIFSIVSGFLMDLFDGLRSRRIPELRTAEGQLIDVYADRMKEVAVLQSHNQFSAALSCFLPSIARAQAEALGNTIPEFDLAGGSALSRSIQLIKSSLLYDIGYRDGSNRIDNSIYLSNMQTFKNRKVFSKSFSWSKLKNYDRESVTRLLFLVELLQKQLLQPARSKEADLENVVDEYRKVNITKLQKELKISFPKI